MDAFRCADARNAGGANNRQQLKEKEAALAALLTEVYGDGEWRYAKTTNRPATALADIAHLAGLNRSQMSVFNFENSPRIRAAKEAEKAADGTKSTATVGSGQEQ